ncbi:restriction endonuclease subunit S [Hymenobacter terricola]|uniref:restriction endonuclease subunit S n=1 Tax=Hymenobacter terricola TaxID=2819236 RepID=UPI001B30A861|nr:restriction endonuclease subunit S [Hymenobacter terricola]
MEWFGTLPQHGNWREVRLKRLVSSWAQKREYEEGETYIGLENIEPWTGKILPGEDGTLTLNTGGESASIGSVFTFGDVLFSKLRPYLAKAILADRQGICSTELLVLAPGPYIDGRFLLYCLLTPGFIELVNSSAFGSKMPRAEWDFIGDIPIPLPPLHQQQQLAALLDRETARLDALVAAKQEQLELIAEKRRALITRAFTQGLDESAPRRATGLPWLGEVPAHWEVVRLKYLAQGPLDYGANEAADEDNPDFPRFIRITDIDEDGNLRSDTFASLAPELAEPYLLSDGDVLLARSGATVGKTFIYRASMGPACFAGYLIRMHPQLRKVLADFIYNFSLTDTYWGQIRESAIQSTIQNFSAEKYGDMVLPLPDLHEQMLITAYIEAETKKLDTLREITEISLGLIHERRAALIAATVTGKLDLINF